MFLIKLRTFAQTIGFAVIGLLMLYGGLSVFTGADRAWGANALAPSQAPTMQTGVFSGTVPSIISYQGILRDAEGKAMSGVHKMVFRIYDDVTAPTPEAIWREEHGQVTVRDGQFSVLLGDLDPIPAALFQRADRFIGITVDEMDEMVPRQRFAAVPYAMSAASATYLSAPDANPIKAVAVNNDGRVGIGVENPQAQLHMQSGQQDLRIDPAAIDSNGTLEINGKSNQNLAFVPVAGNAGFGIRTPQAKLHVVGAENNGADAALKIQSGGQTMLLDGNEIDSSAGLFINNNTNANVAIATGGGRVGIGLAAPAATLDVNGNLNVRGNILNFKRIGPFTLESVNGSNPANKDLGSSAEQMCFLTKAGFNNLDTDPETAFCEVFESGGKWFLKANARPGDDNDAFCAATCLGW